MSERGLEAVRMSGVIKEPSQMSGSGRESLPDVREWLEDSPGCSGVVRRPSLLAGSGW